MSARSVRPSNSRVLTAAGRVQTQRDPLLDAQAFDAILGGQVASAPLARSYRRLIPSGPQTYLLSIAVVAGLQAGALYLIPHIAAAFVWLADVVLRASDVRVVVDNVDFLGSALPTAVVDVPPPRTSELVLCIAFGIAAIFGARFKQRPNPIRYLIVFAALVFIASAIELLLMGRPAYESLDFSAIWLRTSLIIWSLGPTLLGLASMLFPFHVGERVALIVSALIFDSIFSIARYVVVLAGISTAGPIVFPLALTLCGPVLDAFLYVALFSRALVGLSLRLSRSPELWRWSLR